MRAATVALVLLAASSADGQCAWTSLQVALGSTTYVGNNILTPGGVAAAVVAPGTHSCAASSSTPNGGSCTLTKAGYTGATATCGATGTAWQVNPVQMPGIACPQLPIAGGAAVDGVTGDVKTVACNPDFTCSVVPCTVTCTDPTQMAAAAAWGNPTVTCVADCTLATVAGTSIGTDAACVQGGKIASVPTQQTCTYKALAGYQCADTVATCNAAAAMIPAAFTCPENVCTAYTMDAASIAATGIIAGPASLTAPFPCVDQIVLTAVSQTQCTLQCDTSQGYAVKVGTLQCDAMAATGVAPTTTLTCEAIMCGSTPNFADSGVADPGTAITGCNNVRGTPCALTCLPGWVAGTQAPSLTCTQNAMNTGDWTLVGCVGPAMCGTATTGYTCPNGKLKDANSPTTPCATVVLSGTPPAATCTAGDTANDAACCPQTAPCPTAATAPTCACDAGYAVVAPTWSGTAWTHTCTELSCQPYAFPAGAVGGDADPCPSATATQLFTISDNSCSVKCGAGYVDAAGTVKCELTGVRTDPTLTCVEKSCLAYTLPVGVVAGDSGTGCTNGIVLKPVTQPSCSVKCAPGYGGMPASAVINCATSTSNPPVAPTGDITCTQNSCAAYTFPAGVVAGGGTGTPCVDNARLLSGVSCQAQCDTANGYIGSAAAVICATNAVDMEAISGGPACQPTCATFTCAAGYDVANQGVGCTTNTCTTAQCCTLSACPQYANSQMVNGAPTCLCNAGYLGTPTWDTTLATPAWVGPCSPVCSNTQFAQCIAGTTSLPNPATRLCAGTGGCDSTSCNACRQVDCCTEMTCAAPGNTFPGYQFAGFKDNCTTVSQCGAVTCAQGFTGTATIICPAASGPFQLAGCTAVPCPAGASGDGSCQCDLGFVGTPSWDASAGQWLHNCVPNCANTQFTGCSSNGLLRKATPELISCTAGGMTGNPTTDCTVDQCCSAPCSQFQGGAGCSNNGLATLSSPSTRRCSGATAASCSTTACCVAMCNNVQFRKCDDPGYRLRADAAQIACVDANPANCNVTTCCEPTVCPNFACPPGQSPEPNPPSVCSGKCTAAQCCFSNVCQALQPNMFPEYSIAGRNTACTLVADCGSVRCEEGFRQAGIDTPALQCQTNGGVFTATGCVERVCQPATSVSTNLRGYVVENAYLNCNSTSRCGGVTCATGFFPSPGTTPRVICTTDGGTLTGTGCEENACKAPNTAKWMLDNPSVIVEKNTCTRESECGALTCAEGYSGTAILQCNTVGGDFVAGGCSPNECLQPTSYVGYIFTNPKCTNIDDCGEIRCDTGFSGTPRVVCTTPGGTSPFTMTGCIPAPCPPNANGTTCNCNPGYVGVPKFNISANAWSDSCRAIDCPPNSAPPGTCNCNNGFGGTPQWQPLTDGNGAWRHTCLERVCNSPPGVARMANSGYNVPNGNTCTSLATCTVSCLDGYTGTASLICDNSLIMQGRGCTPVSCPAGAGPPGTCACLDGYTGNAPVWNAVTRSFTVACAAAQCPDNTNNVAGSCVCSAGFTGTPVFDRNQGRWVHTCTVGTATPATSCTQFTDIDSAAECARQVSSGVGCSDPSIRPRCERSCCSVGSNSPPTFTSVRRLDFLLAAGSQYTKAAVLTNISPVEAGQSIQPTVPCTSTGGISNPVMSISGSTASLSFVASGITSGTVSCTITDNGTPAASTPVTFDVFVGSTPTTPVPIINNNLAPCGGTCVFIPNSFSTVNGMPTINVNVGEQVVNRPLLNNLHGGTSGEPVTVVCTTPGAPAGALTVPPTVRAVNNQGLLDLTAGPTPQTVRVECTGTDLSAQKLTTNFQFNVQIIDTERILRIAVSQVVDSFRRSIFVNTIKDFLASKGMVVTSVTVYFVCPDTACGKLLNNCPSDSATRLSLGCRRGSDVADERFAAALQSSTSYVDFDIVTTNADGTAAKQVDRATAIGHLETERTRCITSTSTCSLAAINADNAQPVVLTPKTVDIITVAPGTDDDDDTDLEWWHWLLIGLGIFCFLLICCLLIFFCCIKKKKDKSKQVHEDEMHHQQPREEAAAGETRPGTYDDYNYTTRGSEDYYSSYDPNSYATEGEVLEFANDEPVKAQYIDGEYYEGTVWSKAPDGTYNIRWADGSHSEGVPPEQIVRA
eukprot:TRINITY_DN245_c0_g2_i2.p1 TRINITY_DN245_c0_g2~~TRINITY_DN245_c0_g2_i2.p1  ORF type:complete len:2126 (+),score=550.63 TRINITY_DN245_c0_g2_i2:56-6433(+)